MLVGAFGHEKANDLVAEALPCVQDQVGVLQVPLCRLAYCGFATIYLIRQLNFCGAVVGELMWPLDVPSISSLGSSPNRAVVLWHSRLVLIQSPSLITS